MTRSLTRGATSRSARAHAARLVGRPRPTAPASPSAAAAAAPAWSRGGPAGPRPTPLIFSRPRAASRAAASASEPAAAEPAAAEAETGAGAPLPDATVAAALSFLEADLPNLFNDVGIDESRYSPDVVFADPLSKFEGLAAYRFNASGGRPPVPPVRSLSRSR